jgi:MoaA/NifB/PqqE/SkfB family radical SAM enzyme
MEISSHNASRDRVEKLPILILFPHNRCNCRCLMCDIWKVESVEEISPAELERHIQDIRQLGVKWVVFSGGEPLMHSDLFLLCARLRELQIRITILSTGLLLEKHARRIVESCDEVIVSLDGPPAVHDRIRNVRRAYELLERGVHALHQRDPNFPVAARCTLQKQNFSHIAGTVETARRLGLRSVSFLGADLTTTAFNRQQVWPIVRQDEVGLSVAEAADFEARVEALIVSHAADIERGFIVEGPAKLRRIARHFLAHAHGESEVAPVCNAPWVSAVVETDGTVRPCFFHPPIGKLTEQKTLRDVLNSEEALEFRRSLIVSEDPICRRCVCSLNYQEPE